jgi:vitamin B12 transporter
MNKKFIGLSVFTLATAFAYAQETDTLKVTNLKEVVVSDTKFAQSKEKSGKIIEVISAKDLEAKKGQNLANVLSQVAGVEINGSNSSAGKDLGIYIRGGRSNQVLILIDGVPVSDASGISIYYDLRLLPVDQVESIEIMKGASSTLYGTGAATGVINIKLKTTSDKLISGNSYLNIGTQTIAKESNYNPKSVNQGGTINGSTSKFNYYASINRTETTGISEARTQFENDNFENDDFSRVNAMVRLGISPSEEFKFDITGNYDKTKSDFDSGAFSDNDENLTLSEQFRLSFLPKYKYKKGELILNAGTNTITRDLFNYGAWTIYKSNSVNVDLFNKYNFTDKLSLIVGGQFQFFEMSNQSEYVDITEEKAHFNILDPYASVVYSSDFGLNVNLGGRLNIHSRYGNLIIYNVNPSYMIPNTNIKILTSISSAYVTPSLYQLYSDYGDENLTPEKNMTMEAGVATTFLDKKIIFSVVGYHREEKKSIEFDYMTYNYFSFDGRIKVQGVEINADFTVLKNLQLKTNYTFAELDKFSQAYNPKHKVNAILSFVYKKLNTNLSYQFVSTRNAEYIVYPAPDYNAIFMTDILNDYQLVNANIGYKVLNDKINLFLAVDNILDKDFVQTRGFSTLGRNFILGTNFTF